jgi:glycosyltransferase involved in cell wall biosynthesis
MPLVTIAIPTYNRAATFLKPCLESALNQTYDNIEVIVADNGSTDPTEAVVKSYGDSRIRYYRQPINIVPNENFNFCLRQARGAYFILLLDDEQLDADFVETCLHAANFRTDYGLLRTGLRTIDANGNVILESPNLAAGLPLADLFLAWFGGRTQLYLCNTLFNRAALAESGGFSSRHNLFQDVAAQVKVAARLPRVDIATIKATTRQHRAQYTFAATVRAWCEDSLELLDLMCRLAPEQEQLLRRRGARFFATIGYSRANSVRAALSRFQAYAVVYSLFGHRYMPPLRVMLASTAVYRFMRQFKRRVLHLPAWVD